MPWRFLELWHVAEMFTEGRNCVQRSDLCWSDHRTSYAGNVTVILFYFHKLWIHIFLVQLWELKLVQSGAIQEAASHEAPGAKLISQPVAATPVHDLNVPYVATEEPYEAPTSDMNFSRVRLRCFLSFVLFMCLKRPPQQRLPIVSWTMALFLLLFLSTTLLFKNVTFHSLLFSIGTSFHLKQCYYRYMTTHVFFLHFWHSLEEKNMLEIASSNETFPLIYE